MPAGVDAVVAIVRVDDEPEVTEAGLNDAVAPLGRPDALQGHGLRRAGVVAVATVVVAEEPAATLPEAGETETEKSLSACRRCRSARRSAPGR